MALGLEDLSAQMDRVCGDAEKWADDGVVIVEDVDRETGPILKYADHECILDEEKVRETWHKKIDFLLSVIGFAVDLANFYRFPTLCYKNGGGAFLIPYLLMMIFGGIPLFYMELALGQYHKAGAITTWGNICPLFKGVGYTVVIIAFYVAFHYNVMIAWCVYLFFDSFADELPWIHCKNSWNSNHCVQGHKLHAHATQITFITNSSYHTDNSTVIHNSTELSELNQTLIDLRTSPTQEYFERSMLGLTSEIGVENLGSLRWELALSLLTVYFICYFSIWKGIASSGKAVWFTAVFPYIVLTVLLIRGLTLPGAFNGVLYYLSPNLTKLKDIGVWVDAANQVFFSLGPGFGVLMAYASYNQSNNNVYADALATSLINFLTSFMSGFVVFSILGFMAEKTGERIEKVVDAGAGLVFYVYPEAIAQLPGANFWSALFFLMLVTLGLDSSFGGSEAIITAMGDEFPAIRKKREKFVAILFTIYYIGGMFMCTQGGYYLVQFMDNVAAYYSILFAVFMESIIISWIYGNDRFSDDIEEILGFRPGIFWRICWKLLAPAFILGISIFGIIGWKPMEHKTGVKGNYVYPKWMNLVGWCISASSLAAIPIVALYQLCYYRKTGSFCEKFRACIRPVKEQRKLDEVANLIRQEEERLLAEEEARKIAEGIVSDSLLEFDMNDTEVEESPRKETHLVDYMMAAEKGETSHHGITVDTVKRL